MVATYLPNDPLLGSQWHLYLIGRLGFDTGSNTLGLQRIWADYAGNGIHVGIWDTGTQAAHWDLAANYDASLHVTINGTLNDGQPLSSSPHPHGTCVGGLIAADDNGQGGVGVAYDSSVTGVRIFGGQDDINSHWSRYLQTLDHLSDFDVTNHSYGAYPSFYTWGDSAKFQAASENGRGGLGTINVKSAGNSDVDGNGCSIDASRHTVTVAALSSNGQVTYYSTYGAHVLVSAPAGSVTTDLLGSSGYNGLLNGDYTNRFGGTSAAGPITAGVITLMLDANENLGWRDVQNILSYSAAGTGSLYTGVTSYEDSYWKWNGGDNWNGGGLHFSEDYGYGMVNAYNAVRMSEVWSVLNPTAATSANEAAITTGTIAVNRAINDLSTLNYSFDVAQNVSLEHVSFTVNLTHTWFTDLEIRLISPTNTVMTLYDGSTGSSSTSDYGFNYTFGVDGLRGEMSAGTWTVQIEDTYRYDTGVLNSVKFTGFGSAVTTNDVYHYTDEVLAVLGRPGQSGRQTLSDGDGGTDWIDAAAMYRNLYLDLGAGQTSTLAGTAFLTVAAGTLIENAIAGDGDDVLMGNSLDNTFYGMRGDDTLNACGGVDTACFIGNLADYTITFAGGVTTVSSNSGKFGTDTLVNFEWIQFDDQTIADPSLPDQAPDVTAPTLVSMSPADDAPAVAASSNIVLNFDESVMAGAGDIVIYNGDGTVWSSIAAADTSQVTFTANTVTVNPVGDLSASSDYYVLVDATAIADRSDNPFVGIADATAFNFVTADNTVMGTNGADLLTGTAGADTIYGLGGNDLVYGYSGDDTLYGGDGDDVMHGNSGADVLYGGNGNDVLSGRADDDTVYGDAGNDWLFGQHGNDTLYGGDGHDNLYGADGDDTLYGGDGNDILIGALGDDTLFGGAGNDAMHGNRGTDVLYGDDGDDVLCGRADDDLVYGGAGDDWLFGQHGNDMLDGGTGADYMLGGVGNDIYVVDSVYDWVSEGLGAGVDTVVTSLSYYRLGTNVENLTYNGSSTLNAAGNILDNVMLGGDGNDVFISGKGEDTIYGGAGDDILRGARGCDSLYGGAGADQFLFMSVSESEVGANRDVIQDFETGVDNISLLWADAKTDVAGNQAFSFVGAAAFSGTSGELRYDAGIVSGDVNGDQVADFEIEVASAPALTENDFLL